MTQRQHSPAWHCAAAWGLKNNKTKNASCKVLGKQYRFGEKTRCVTTSTSKKIRFCLWRKKLRYIDWKLPLPLRDSSSFELPFADRDANFFSNFHSRSIEARCWFRFHTDRQTAAPCNESVAVSRPVQLLSLRLKHATCRTDTTPGKKRKNSTNNWAATKKVEFLVQVQLQTHYLTTTHEGFAKKARVLMGTLPAKESKAGKSSALFCPHFALFVLSAPLIRKKKNILVY